MASVPNMRAGPLPVPAGNPPPAAADPAAFAKQFSEIPEELLRIAAAILSGDGGEAVASDGKAESGGDAAAADPADPADPEASADAPSDAAQLAALAPLLQSLPAMVAAPVAAPVTAPGSETQPKIETAAAATPAQTALPPVPTAALNPAPTAAPTPAPGGKIRQVKPEALSDETGADTGGEEPTSALDAAAKEAISTAKRVIEATLRATGPAIAEAAPKAVRAAASTLDIVREALPAALAAETQARTADISTTAALAMPAAAAPTPSVAAQPRDAEAPAAGPASGPALDLANDAEWLDRLARDIAQASGNEGIIRFRLHPQTLGHLRVELSQGDHGTSIRLTADTEQARAILADAQPRLVAEARAQGVRIAETHVDLSGSDRRFSGDPRRQEDFRQTPMIRTAGDAATDADAPERPGHLRSDRYA